MHSGLSIIEENYLKAIYKLQQMDGRVSTNELASEMGTSAASATDMIKKLSNKAVIQYEKYYGVQLTTYGANLAIQLVRRHRLWEVFLHDKLGYSWEKVHDLAEELEHVNIHDLADRLDAYLGHPKSDPHGDPIPDGSGQLPKTDYIKIDELRERDSFEIKGIVDSDAKFLNYLTERNLGIGCKLRLISIDAYAETYEVLIEATHQSLVWTKRIAQNILIKKT